MHRQTKHINVDRQKGRALDRQTKGYSNDKGKKKKIRTDDWRGGWGWGGGGGQITLSTILCQNGDFFLLRYNRKEIKGGSAS